tara:strand:- start:1719 stop:2504 length:786 start_codon:yes stop_codon:yes gene_type:complete
MDNTYFKKDLSKTDEENLYTLQKSINMISGFKGGWKREYEEQLMAMKYIKPDSKVLELGSNIGRNTLIISSLLENDKNLVTLETMQETVQKLKQNRDINKRSFHIENSALSYIKLMQNREGAGGACIPFNQSLLKDENYTPINTITFSELQKKYNIVFDTLVLDCEGALYHILKNSNENILENINLLIMENDYRNYDHKLYVDSIFKKSKFRRVYVESLTKKKIDKPSFWNKDGSHTRYPCYQNFYEVWKKKRKFITHSDT